MRQSTPLINLLTMQLRLPSSALSGYFSPRIGHISIYLSVTTAPMKSIQKPPCGRARADVSSKSGDKKRTRTLRALIAQIDQKHVYDRGCLTSYRAILSNPGIFGTRPTIYGCDECDVSHHVNHHSPQPPPILCQPRPPYLQHGYMTTWHSNDNGKT
jgi:hypothetical protein